MLHVGFELGEVHLAGVVAGARVDEAGVLVDGEAHVDGRAVGDAGDREFVRVEEVELEHVVEGRADDVDDGGHVVLALVEVDAVEQAQVAGGLDLHAEFGGEDLAEGGERGVEDAGVVAGRAELGLEGREVGERVLEVDGQLAAVAADRGVGGEEALLQREDELGGGDELLGAADAEGLREDAAEVAGAAVLAHALVLVDEADELGDARDRGAGDGAVGGGHRQDAQERVLGAGLPLVVGALEGLAERGEVAVVAGVLVVEGPAVAAGVLDLV
jgi:hypothetical protein